MTAIPLSTAVSGPLSSAILMLDGALGLAGWQWLYLTETLPSLFLGIVTLRYLPDTPAQVAWLSEPERAWLTNRLAAEAAAAPARKQASVWAALRSHRMVLLCLCYCGADLGLYGVVFWIPQILAHAGVSSRAVGYAVAVPYAIAALGMVWWARRSDRARERRRHIALAGLVGFAGLAASAYLPASPLLALLTLTIGVTGTLAMLPVFWTLPSALLRGAAAAGGIALINAIGNVGSFAGPYAVGWIRESTGSFTWGLTVVAGAVLLAGFLALLLGHDAAAEYAEIHDAGLAVHNAPR